MEFHPGTKIEKFELVSQIGVGGMAVVWKALDRRLNREVAIKFIRTEMFAPAVLDQVLKRFEREAQALARLEHPNIVTVFDFGEYEGSPYLVMNYLPNGTLQQRMDHALSLDQAVGFLAPIARALGHAHQRGILHRDIKPSNVLFNKDDVPQLSDFGIARILDAEAGQTLTGTGFSVGTPAYMAPEQWRNEVLPQTDQYALGVILFELLTGQKPYQADTPGGFFEQQLTRPLPSLRALVSELPQAAEDLLHKALARQPGERFASMEAFAVAMEKLRTTPPQPAPKPAGEDGLMTAVQPVTPPPLPVDSGATLAVSSTPPPLEGHTAVQPTPIPAPPPVAPPAPPYTPPPFKPQPIPTPPAPESGIGLPPAPLPGEEQLAPGGKARAFDPLWQRLLGGLLIGLTAGVLVIWIVGGF